MILLIDNYDSFVHNLARYVGELGYEREVVRNDAITVGEALAREPEAIILSPGPCGPDEAGISVALARAAAEAHVPLLGVCLGHQCIAAAFGGTVRRTAPMHGKPARIRHDGTGIFRKVPSPFTAARYHSLVANLAEEGPLRATAHSEDGTLMALAHTQAPIHGVQFHPESVLTEHGHLLLANFLNADAGMAARRRA
ncbi:aminodeoxychorismate/anthranilate synthase component II [Parvibaculum sedimenti]|uniref:Aminodeoxychorismate/anthranilate synthase component II n=1 Tax=Parvibaculum sedimenti TaxID=2608632 RepID=A0A6N6VPF0_9HYPH|nr:aminodeoxychorismate/anthranilate synthase component II [Parvibaculum sedimenti]KAB7742067.1 aminodeoxychorismate/anthranilate synthase component II [Parvibaculum sedimenti]